MNYFNPYQQYNYNQYTQQQTNYLPLTFISGIEGAKAFIVAPNQTVYLRDSDAEIIYIKTADSQGRYNLKAYNLVPVEQSKPAEYATMDALKDLEERLKKLIGGTHE